MRNRDWSFLGEFQPFDWRKRSRPPPSAPAQFNDNGILWAAGQGAATMVGAALLASAFSFSAAALASFEGALEVSGDSAANMAGAASATFAGSGGLSGALQADAAGVASLVGGATPAVPLSAPSAATADFVGAF